MSNQAPPPPGGPTQPPPPPPPPSSPPPSFPPPGGGRPRRGLDLQRIQDALQGADRRDLLLVGAGLVALVFSLVPLWYSASFEGASDHSNAWHGFFPWFGVLLTLAGAVFVALVIVRVLPPLHVSAHLVAAVVFGLATVFLLVALLTNPYVGQAQDLCEAAGQSCSRGELEAAGFDFGTGAFLWLTFLVALAATVVSALRFVKTRPADR